MTEEQSTMEQHIHTLSTGVRVHLGAISLATLTDAQKRIEQPPIPKVLNPETGREEEDREHPDYLVARERADMERANAVMETLALFAVELVDGLPQDDRWLKKLRLLERRGRLDLAGFDLEDSVDLEFLFTKYVALSLPDWTTLFQLAGMEETVASEMMNALGEVSRE